ncbi:flagellar hook-associated protein FlgL [Pseudodesulfovibrio sp.]|uniref:flagellar hook-associated protein FlgL n=1 Tax=unclassified Pseudodesulfovibrio TaxID=2661612 RepID=UPI003AFFE509
MRVTQQMLFNRYVSNMNKSLTSLIDLNTKAQTQKRVNRPSDDPTGMTRILGHRDTIRSLSQYKENIATAKGWISSQDEALLQASTLMTKAKELAEQAATGTMDADNRKQVSFELRSIFEQMIGLANTEFEGKSIFAGHKVDGNAYEQVMWLTTNDDRFAATDFSIQGSSSSTVLVQFYDQSGGTAVGGDMNLSDANLRARYSSDGGETWTDGATLVPNGSGGYALNMDGAGSNVIFDSDATVKVNDPTDKNNSEGTWLWVRPTARYIGDDRDLPPSVDPLDPNYQVTATASGAFAHNNVTIRIDNDTAVAMNEDIEYSYSLDGGINWVTGNVAQADTTSNAAVLSVPNGGVLNLVSNGTNQLQPGAQFVVHPRSADIKLDISGDEQITINNVGKGIFGGIYTDPDSVLAAKGSSIPVGSANTERVFASNGAPKMAVSIEGQDEKTKNLFEVLGNLVAFTETNNQTGVQQCLADLARAQEQVLNNAAEVGGRENQLTIGSTILDGLQLNEKTLLSSIEDADVSELMTDLAQQQLVYQAVLQSTSTIMQLNLSKFI